MRELGIAIYPEQGSLEENRAYLERAAEHGFKRVFTCLISVEEKNGTTLEDFRALAEWAGKLDMQVIADVSPGVFNALKISHRELQFFAQLNLAGIRLDLGFSGLEESAMTYNPYDLKIELNMSGGTKYLENILGFNPNKDNLLGCHNFYPHRYTGLSREHFLKCSRQFKENGIRTAAFVSSRAAVFGPWPFSEGLCTLEEHRGLPIETQAKDLFNTGLIDDVIIANCFASEDELADLGSMDRNVLTLNVELAAEIPALERKIALEEPHFNRGDVSAYMIRSTQSRVKYAGSDFALFNPAPIKRGDILIDSSLYERYAGELQIALKDMDNSGKTNVVGKIANEEHFLLDLIRPWQPFILKEKSDEEDRPVQGREH